MSSIFKYILEHEDHDEDYVGFTYGTRILDEEATGKQLLLLAFPFFKYLIEKYKNHWEDGSTEISMYLVTPDRWLGQIQYNLVYYDNCKGIIMQGEGIHERVKDDYHLEIEVVIMRNKN